MPFKRKATAKPKDGDSIVKRTRGSKKTEDVPEDTQVKPTRVGTKRGGPIQNPEPKSLEKKESKNETPEREISNKEMEQEDEENSSNQKVEKKGATSAKGRSKNKIIMEVDSVDEPAEVNSDSSEPKEAEIENPRSRKPRKTTIIVEDKDKKSKSKPKALAKSKANVKNKVEVKLSDDDKESTEKKSKLKTEESSDEPDKNSELEEEDEKPKTKPKRVLKGRRADAGSSETLLNPTETNYKTLDFACTKKDSSGNAPNIRIASWNVDGLRAWVKKDGLKYLDYEKPDIFCIQESKCSLDKLPEELKSAKGYLQFWHTSDKDGYAGVGLWTRKEPLSVQYGIDDEEHNEEGRCVTAEFEKFYVVSVYVPNAGKKLVTLPKRLDWNKSFKTFIEGLNAKKPVIIAGDMNVAHSEIDLKNPKANQKSAGFTKQERDGFTDFLKDGYVDTYRKLNPDETDIYTFWSYFSKSRSRNIGWRLDYFIVSERLFENVCDSVVRSEVLGSDHCPITLFLNV